MRTGKDCVPFSVLSVHSFGSSSGTALIVTLLIVTILTGLVVEFAREVYTGTSAIANWSSSQRASLAARSGQTVSSAFLETITQWNYTYPGEIMFPLENEIGDDTFLLVKIIDESAKFDINDLILPDGKTTKDEALKTLKKLFEYLNINPDLALFVADWIDTDQEPRLADSEFKAKNAPFVSVQELRYIQGFTKEVFETVYPYVTVYSSGGKVNINTAQLPVLYGLDPEMTEELAQKIIDYRENTPFEDINDVQNVSGMETIGQRFTTNHTVKGYFFRVTTTATVRDISRIIESVMDTSGVVKDWREY